MDISIKFVANELKLQESQVQTVLNLLSEGSTVPFISRYRKAMTGGLDEEQIEAIDKIYTYNVELNKRKEAIIDILKENKLLTKELENKINASKTKAEVENIYEPFKVGKKTKATEAISLGLEPLAKSIFEAADPKFNPYREAHKYLNDKVTDEEFAIEQAKFIISQWISQEPETRLYVKNQITKYGKIVTKAKRNAAEKDENKVYENYYDFQQPVSKIPNHRILAINRAENEKIINYNFEYNKSKISYDLNNKYFKIKTTGKIINESLEDALERLIYPSIEREIKSDLFERAQSSAIDLFANNLEEMLLAPAVKGKTILAIDPAYVNGCKIAVISKNGEFLEKQIIYPNPPKKDIKGSVETMAKVLAKYPIDIIVIGNGTASRETEEFVAKLINSNASLKHIQYTIVSEVGASVYSASKIAIEEFPDLNVEERSAINIGRKFQDPLNELVKIDPKAIGVGQYQHDVNQKELSEALGFKVNKVVNQVGVDVNTATKQILSYISGLSNKIAENIVLYKAENGSFKDRKELKNVKGLGPKSYEQAIGFLRIHDSENLFDRTEIHPESYSLANKVVKYLDLDLANIDVQKLAEADIKKIAEDLDSNTYDIELIIEALKNPSKDIRDSKEGLILRSDVLNMEDLQVGMQIEGTVQNITDFGVFCYIGIKQAAFIHISKLNKKFVNHPSEVVSVGQRVNLEIVNIDKERSRIEAKLV